MNIKIDLSGLWQFRLDREKQGIEAHYETLSFHDTILLPTTVSEAAKGTPHHRRDTGHLTDPYEMEGYAWYRKTVSLPLKDSSELSGKHFELTLERTRISYVWVDGEFAGSFDSLVAAHRYDLTGKIKTLNPDITVMISNTDYKVPGGHLTSPDTQTNWNGILGEISLTVRGAIRIGTVKAKCLSEDGKEGRRGFALNLPIHCRGPLPRPVQIRLMPVLCRLKDIYAAPDKIIPSEKNYEDFLDWTPLPGETRLFDVTLQPGENNIELFSDLSSAPKLWDEEDPYVYRLHLSCRDAGNGAQLRESAFDTASVWCGLRSFTAGETHFYINGRKTFLRGKHEGMVFPLTGYAPTDVASWLHVMKIARDFGINHYRFHTCCPPEAAFVAADLLGIYMQPELCFWGTFNGPDDEGYDRAAQDFLETEGFRMLEAFGNHPSYCMMSMGNELWGNACAINDLLAKYKAFRPDVLYTQGSNNFFWSPNIQPNDDFFSGVRFSVERQIRGSYAMCDAPLGHVQTGVPGTRFHYDEAIRPSRAKDPAQNASGEPLSFSERSLSEACKPDITKERGLFSGFSAEEQFWDEKDKEPEKRADSFNPLNKDTVEIQYGTGVRQVSLSGTDSELIPRIPVISHEIGQYETYPDFREIEKYTGVLKARNLEEFKRRLEEKGMLALAGDFFRCSGALAAACYKDELETALRSTQLAGFQILDIQDFPGQGTALIGVLNAFMENKGLVSAAEWRRFCSGAVIQAEFDSYVVIIEKPFDFTVSLSYYQRSPLPADMLVCRLTDSDGNVIWRDSKPVTALTVFNRDFSGSERASYGYGNCPQRSENTFGEEPCKKDTGKKETFSKDTFAEEICEKGLFTLGDFSLTLPKRNVPSSLTLTVELTELGICNNYTLWLYPPVEAKTDFPVRMETDRYTTAVVCSLDQLPSLSKNHRAGLLFLPPRENKASIQGTYCTDFWCYPMFYNISLNAGKEPPVGTMGLLIRREHAALSGFPCESYTTPQWHSIVNASRSTILDGTEIIPIVQTIDNFSRNHRLGMIYELYLQDLDLKLLVCTSDLPGLISKGRPEAFALYKSLLSYISSPGATCRKSADAAVRHSGGHTLVTHLTDAHTVGMSLAAFRELVSHEITEAVF